MPNNEKILEEINKKFGKGTIRELGDDYTVDVDVFSTSSSSLDEALGVGGVPRGRITEIFGPESCLSADTFIQYEIKTPDGKRVNHKGGTIKRLYHRFHQIPTGDGRIDRHLDKQYEFFAPSINENGRIIQNKINNVVKTGKQKVYELVTRRGYEIQATKNHKFFIGGKYERLRHLNKGDVVYIHNNTPYTVDEYKYKNYKKWFVKDHPNPDIPTKTINGKYEYKRLTEARGVVEADLNNLTPEQYRNVLNNGDKEYINSLEYVPTNLHIHHKDENIFNNKIDNLLIVNAYDHGKIHSNEKQDNLRYTIIKDEIADIREVGEKQTYDIQMQYPFNNYVANNIIVHNSGKTTLALHVMAEAQKQNENVAFIDAEHAFDPLYARNLGIDTDKMAISQPNSGEEALEITQMLVESGVYAVIVVDSVSALTPKAEIEGEMGDSHVGLQARLMSQAMRKLTSRVSKTNTCLIFINQIREKVGVMYGNPETTSGGRALRFYSSVRMDIRRIGAVKDGDEIIGNKTRVRVKKNKVAPPFKKAEFQIIYGKGIDTGNELLKEAMLVGLISKNGSWYSYKGETIAQGQRSTIEWVNKNKDKIEKEIDETEGQGSS